MERCWLLFRRGAPAMAGLFIGTKGHGSCRFHKFYASGRQTARRRMMLILNGRHAFSARRRSRHDNFGTSSRSMPTATGKPSCEVFTTTRTEIFHSPAWTLGERFFTDNFQRRFQRKRHGFSNLSQWRELRVPVNDFPNTPYGASPLAKLVSGLSHTLRHHQQRRQATSGHRVPTNTRHGLFVILSFFRFLPDAWISIWRPGFEASPCFTEPLAL